LSFIPPIRDYCRGTYTGYPGKGHSWLLSSSRQHFAMFRGTLWSRAAVPWARNTD